MATRKEVIRDLEEMIEEMEQDPDAHWAIKPGDSQQARYWYQQAVEARARLKALEKSNPEEPNAD